MVAPAQGSSGQPGGRGAGWERSPWLCCPQKQSGDQWQQWGRSWACGSRSRALFPAPPTRMPGTRGPKNVWERPVSAGVRVSSQPGAQRASRKTVTDKAGALAFRAPLLTLAPPAPTQGPGAGDEWGLEAGGSSNLPRPGPTHRRKGVPWGAGPRPTHTSHAAPLFPPRHMEPLTLIWP